MAEQIKRLQRLRVQKQGIRQRWNLATLRWWSIEALHT